MKLLLKKAAGGFREGYGISNTEPLNLKSLMLRLNVLTYFKPLSEKFSGMAVKTSGDYKFMLINSNKSVGHQHFTICHELYHLFIQKDFNYMMCIAGKFQRKSDIQEYYADIFAANLLLPEDGILELIPNEQLSRDKITIDVVLKIEQYYQCSRNALLYRLKEMDLLSSEAWAKFDKDKVKSAREHGYDQMLYKPNGVTLLVGEYGNLAKKLFDAEKISESHYLKLMGDIGVDILKEDPVNGED